MSDFVVVKKCQNFIDIYSEQKSLNAFRIFTSFILIPDLKCFLKEVCMDMRYYYF